MAYLLVIDDDADFANAVAKMLRATGHEVEIELEAQNTINRMENRIPDLAILDVMFPESSSAGFELARGIRSNERLRNVPIIMLTAVNEKFPLGFSSRDIDPHWLPVDDFVEKPVDFDVLKNKVSEALAKAAADNPRGQEAG